jgi:methionyl aminopeptidase
MKLYRPLPDVTISLKDEGELELMREAGRIVALTQAALKEAVRPGISTLELDKIGETVIRDHGAIPAFIGQEKPNSPRYKHATTASVNHEVIHGIPRADRILQEGDIVSLDVGTIYKGFVGDGAWTYAVGELKPSVRRLLDMTEKSLYLGIEQVRPGAYVKDIAMAIENFINQAGYGIIRDYTGHGVGAKMWEEPQIPNYWPRGNKTRRSRRAAFDNVRLVPGMTFAIEPMICTGLGDVKELEDGWTVVTTDKSLCAHFEHTVAVTENGVAIMTQA